MRVLDFHIHIGEDKDGTVYTISNLLESMEESGVTHSVIFPFNAKGDLVEASLELYEQSHGQPFYPFIRFDPGKMDADRLEKHLDKFYGVKLHPRSQAFDPLAQEFFQLYEVISKYKKPLLFHSRKENNPYSDPDRIAKLAEHFPELHLVIGHFANNSPEVIKAMGKNEKVYLETSIMGSTPKFIEILSSKLGAERLIFGSDAPYSDQLIERMKIDRSKITQNDKEKILYSNATGLLGLR